MRREYVSSNRTIPSSPIPFEANCVFYTPLGENDLTDKISGIVPTVNSSYFKSYDAGKGAYLFKTTSGGQRALIYNIPNVNVFANNNYFFSVDIFVTRFSGTCDFLSFGSGRSDCSNALSVGETHRFTGFTTGVWHKLAVTVSNSMNIIFYMDGNVVRTSNINQYSVYNFQYYNRYISVPDNVVIGGGFKTYNYDAYIKNVATYNRVLTQDEIRTL